MTAGHTEQFEDAARPQPRQNEQGVSLLGMLVSAMLVAIAILVLTQMYLAAQQTNMTTTDIATSTDLAANQLTIEVSKDVDELTAGFTSENVPVRSLRYSHEITVQDDYP